MNECKVGSVSHFLKVEHHLSYVFQLLLHYVVILVFLWKKTITNQIFVA